MAGGIRRLMFTAVFAATVLIIGTGFVAPLLLQGGAGTGVNALGERCGLLNSGELFFTRPGTDLGGRIWRLQPGDHGATRLAEGVEGDPSYDRHAGQRWFVTVRANGAGPRRPGESDAALEAVREDGRTVRLMEAGALIPLRAPARWVPGSGDRRVSWISVRRGCDGRIVEGGIYEAEVSFDDAGDLLGLVETPPRLRLELTLIATGNDDPWPNALAPDIQSYDWSPDAASIVYETWRHRLVAVDLCNGHVVTLDEGGTTPVWSPDGSRIAFRQDDPFGAIVTVRPDGTDRQLAVDASGGPGSFTVSMPLWSRTEGSLIYQRLLCDSVHPEVPCDVDTIALAADGREKINLTSAISGFACPVALR